MGEHAKGVEPEKKPEEVFQEVTPKNEMKIVIFVRNEKIDFRLPVRYWTWISKVREETHRTFSEIVQDALDKYFKGLGYGQNKNS